ncbi:hypothetical protein HDU88_002261 [Geranomyces variabilis]|nr:hypothetical protein HDU88_002261 [Geranomyces variabilis]
MLTPLPFSLHHRPPQRTIRVLPHLHHISPHLLHRHQPPHNYSPYKPLVALHKRVAADRSALADAELGAVDARRAVEAVGPVTAAEGRLRELVAVVGALDGAYARFVGAVRDSVVKMPLVGLRMDSPAVVGQVLDAAAGEIHSALAAAAEPLATIETLATVLADTRAVAETAAKEMRECDQLAAELRAAAAVRDSHAIGRKQLAASARRESDELAWLVAS